MPAHQLPHPFDGVPDVEQLADQRLDPAQRPPLVTGEPVRQRPFPQLQLQPCPLLRAQLLPRHRPPGPQRFGSAVPPGPVPPPHRPGLTRRSCAISLIPSPRANRPAASQPQPLTPLLLGGRVPAPLRIPHALVIRPDGSRRHDLSSTSSSLVSGSLLTLGRIRGMPGSSGMMS